MGRSYRVAVLGGTGDAGGGLALRFAAAGHQVIIGSRNPSKAAATAAELALLLPNSNLSGMANTAAADSSEIAILTVPYHAQRTIAAEVSEALLGKILIDVTVPLVAPHITRVQLPAGTSAVAALQEFLGKQVRVVSAFQNVSHRHLRNLDHPVDCDILVCGDEYDACTLVMELIETIGMRGVYAGPIANSAAAEALSSVLIGMNQRNEASNAGVRITGLKQTT